MPNKLMKLSALAAAMLPLLFALPLAPPPRAEEPRVIEIVAKRFQFTPAELTLKKDEPVILRLRSEDVTHGFFMKQLGINTTIPPGTNTDVALTPHEVGKFSVICHHFCGAGHGNMHMTIVVE
jgi:cytochrome c oxidase subunit 2